MADAYDIGSPIGRRRLTEAVRQSRKYLAPFRINRHSHIREYVGKHYSNNGARRAVPKNIIDQLHTVMVMELATNNPRSLVLTEKRHLKGEAYAREYALNQEIKRIELSYANRTAVSETLFAGMGIVRVGVSQYGSNDDGLPLTRTYATPVDFDDWVHDCSAPSWADVEFEGNRYSINREEAIKSGLYDNAEIRKSMALEYTTTDEWGNERVSSILRDEENDSENSQFTRQIHFVDLFFRRRGKLCTFLAAPARNTDWVVIGRPVREVEWTGPPGGMYHKLIYKDVPANTMGKSMIGDIRSLHDVVNGLLRKSARDSMNSKAIFAYSGASANDAQRIQRTKDGDYIRLDHGADAAKMHRFDATNPTHMGLVSYYSQQANEVGGNFALLGGLGAQTDTLGQDRLLHQSASRLVEDMQERTEKFVRGIVEDVAWYLFDDPDLQRDVMYPIPNTDISFSQRMTADSLEGDFRDFEFQVEVHSMRPRSPKERLVAMQQLMQAAQQFATSGTLDQQSMTIDVKGYLETMAHLLGAQIEWKSMMVTADEPLASKDRSHEASMPTETKRTYERVNRSGMTPEGYEQEFQKSMFGQGRQLQESA